MQYYTSSVYEDDILSIRPSALHGPKMPGQAKLRPGPLRCIHIPSWPSEQKALPNVAHQRHWCL